MTIVKLQLQKYVITDSSKRL